MVKNNPFKEYKEEPKKPDLKDYGHVIWQIILDDYIPF